MSKYFIISLLLLIVIFSCKESKDINTSVNLYGPSLPGPMPPDTTGPDTTGGGSDTTITNPEQIFITDRSGKKWNVTHAVNKYGFEAGNFQFGLGPYAIQPINDPVFIERDENGYPSATSTMQIIGTTINGDTRAYPLETLNRYEILNDVFAEDHVAVGF